MKKGGYDMLTLYTAIGNYRLTEKGLPLVTAGGRDCALDAHELLLWSSLAFRILTYQELKAEFGKRHLKNNDELMECLYHDETTDCDSIVTDCRVSETRFPVLTAVANLYFKQQITFQIL
jgi:hypothetical protein